MKFRFTLLQIFAVATLVVLFGVTSAGAQAKPALGGAPCPGLSGAPCTETNSKNSGFNLDIKISNPLKVNTIQDAIKLFVNAVVRLAIPVIVIFFLWSGLRFIFARGNPTEVGKAKNMFFYTVIGTLLILGAWTITNAIIGTVNSITN